MTVCSNRMLAGAPRRLEVASFQRLGDVLRKHIAKSVVIRFPNQRECAVAGSPHVLAHVCRRGPMHWLVEKRHEFTQQLVHEERISERERDRSARVELIEAELHAAMHVTGASARGHSSGVASAQIWHLVTSKGSHRKITVVLKLGPIVAGENSHSDVNERVE